MAHLPIRVLLSGKINDILNFACKWIELENTILSEINPEQQELTPFWFYDFALFLSNFDIDIRMKQVVTKTEMPFLFSLGIL